MRKLVLALGLTFAATPLLADSKLAFEAVEPEGLDSKATQMVEALQAGMPAQLGAFTQNGYSYYGALAVPMGVALKPEYLISVANLGSPEDAKEKVLEACLAQTGSDCTVVGLLVPGS